MSLGFAIQGLYLSPVAHCPCWRHPKQTETKTSAGSMNMLESEVSTENSWPKEGCGFDLRVLHVDLRSIPTFQNDD